MEEQPLSPKSSTAGEEHEKQYLDNVTFEIIDSQIPADEHVHVRGEDKSLTRINNDNEKLSKQTRAYDIPDSTSETNVQETTDSKIEPASRGVLRELNNDDARGTENYKETNVPGGYAHAMISVSFSHSGTRSGEWWREEGVNPFSPSINMHILLTIHLIFLIYSTARKYWCISTRRNLIRRHFVFLEFAAVGRKPQPR